MEESVNPTSYVMLAGFVASVGTILFLFQRHIRGIPLISYELRFRVPWGPGVGMLALFVPMITILSVFIGPAVPREEPTIVEQHTINVEQNIDESNPTSFVTKTLGTSVVLIGFVLALAMCLHFFVGAGPRDLGLPTNGKQLLSDMGLGFVAWLASLLPIFALQYLLTIALEPETEHPLIDELQLSHTPAMMLVGVVMVVFAAPLFEEFVFRVILQGWLEKWEDESIGFAGSARPAAPPIPDAEEATDDIAEEAEVLPFPIDSTPVPLPRTGVLRDCPHGWLPILLSGFLFGLAHLGNGVSPVPLVLFGIVLGYLYQRPHRLAPSITAHALFNGFSMLMLWLSLK